MNLDIEHRPEKKLSLAIPLVLLASLFMAVMALVVKISAVSCTAESMVFWRNFVSLFMLLPWLLFGPPPISVKYKLKTSHWNIHLIRGVSSFISVYLFFIL